MRKFTAITIVLLLVVALGVTAVLAREPEAAPATAPLLQEVQVPLQQEAVAPAETAPAAAAIGPGQMRGHMRAGGAGAGMGPIWGEETPTTIIAAELGMTVEDVTAALQSGSTLADLAAQQGTSVEALAGALSAAHEAALNDAVAAGTITAEQAEFMQARMNEMMTLRIQEGRFFGGPGYAGQGGNCPFGNGEGQPGFSQGGGMQGRGFGFGQRGMQGQGNFAPANGQNG
jgi:hypothetical protein